MHITIIGSKLILSRDLLEQIIKVHKETNDTTEKKDKGKDKLSF